MLPSRITVHCSATTNGRRYPAAQIEVDHLARGFSSIGYHQVIQPDGEVERGRSLNEKGAHVEGANEGNIGICLVGTDRFTRAQWDGLRNQIDAIRGLYSIPPWELYTHREWPTAVKQGKTCPNFRTGVLVAWYCGHHEKAIEPFLLKGGA